MARGAVSLANIWIFMLDEADRTHNLGFGHADADTGRLADTRPLARHEHAPAPKARLSGTGFSP
jgi:hypothetical protein